MGARAMSGLPEGFVLDAPAAPAALPEGFVIDSPSVAADVAKSAGIGVVKGGVGLAGLPGDAMRLIQDAFDRMGLQRANNPNAQFPPGSGDLTQRLENLTGQLYQPKTTAGEYAQSLGEFLPALAGGPEGLAARLGRQVVAPAVASETAGQLTKGTAVEPYARAIAGIGAGGAGALRSASEAAVPTISELKAAGRAGYQAPEIAAVQIKPSAVHGLAAQIENDLVGQGFRPTAKSAGDTFAEIRALRPPSAVQSVGVADIDTARKALGNLAKEVDAVGKATPEAVAAGKAIGHIDQFLPNLRQADLLAGDAAQANAILQEARGNWGAAKRAELIETKADNAALQAASTYGGGNINNATRQALRPLLKNNAAGASGFGPEALAQLNRVVTGGPIGNAARQLGRLAPVGPVGIGMHVAGAVGTGGASLPLAGAAYAAKKLGETLTRREVSRLDEMLRSQSPLARQRAQNFIPDPRLNPLLGGLLGGLFATADSRQSAR
jgi:hypothetical protein